MTRTGKIPVLLRSEPEPFVELHPDGAVRLGVAAGDVVRVVSRRGQAQARCRLTQAIKPGSCFMPFHWGSLRGEAVVNQATIEAFDPISKQPDSSSARCASKRQRPMLDQLGRRITYLRIWVIDRCNLRCIYCMPQGWVNKTRLSEFLTNDELVELAAMFAKLGITKIRLTGGEPLLRPELVELVARLAQISGIRVLAMSTNGILLKRHARALKEAGLHRVNVSLDTLSREKFAAITGMDQWQTVVEGIAEAKAVGLKPVKINTVLMKGVNDDEILALVAFAIEQALALRFIEWMPTHPLVDLEREGKFLSNEVARATIEERYRLIPDDPDPHSPAKSFLIEGTGASVGFINPLSNFFCAMCNRVRLKVNGRIKTCLHGKEELDLKTLLRGGVPRGEIERQIAERVFFRPEQHFLNHPEVQHQDFVMTQVGG